MQTETRAATGTPADETGAVRWGVLAGVWLCHASFGLVATSLATVRLASIAGRSG